MTSINNISFTAKIPVSTCKVQDTITKEYVPATIFEYDCKDESDIEEIAHLNEAGFWKYMHAYLNTAMYKLTTTDKRAERLKSYIAYTQDGHPLGICDTIEEDEETVVMHLAKNPNSNLHLQT